ncbi:MAG TPA: hypothetical protein VMX13_13965 [Sedimentisphaerales bacterium]|nr:hypothetical protein [Sedimentisphaerales bacterium]
MRLWFNKKARSRSKPPICKELDAHNWQTKMEVQRLIAGKPELSLQGRQQYTWAR